MIFEVVKIRGKCPVYTVGDRIYVKGPQIDLERSDAICIHALPSLLHYAIALREGIDPAKLGLAKKGGDAYIQCLDPGEPYTEGGTVLFKCYREKMSKIS